MGMGKGKRKLPMELIKNKQSRMVSFSKRRKGLMKKAEEFNSITGCSIAVIVLSEAGRPFVYGAPSFDSVIHRFQQNINNNNNNDGILTQYSHTDPSPENLLMGDQGQGSNIEEDNAAVYGNGTHSHSCCCTTTVPDPENVVVPDQQPWPPAALPHHIFAFDAPPPPSDEILIGQGSTPTTDFQQENANDFFNLIDAAPWLAASSDHATTQVVGQGSTPTTDFQQENADVYGSSSSS